MVVPETQQTFTLIVEVGFLYSPDTFHISTMSKQRVHVRIASTRFIKEINQNISRQLYYYYYFHLKF